MYNKIWYFLEAIQQSNRAKKYIYIKKVNFIISAEDNYQLFSESLYIN